MLRLRPRLCALFLHIVCLLLLTPVASRSATGDRVLVVHEEDTIHHSFSQFFYSLQTRGYQLTFVNPKQDQSATLTKYEARLYDHLVLFPQKLKAMGPNLTPQILVEFVNDGGNVFIGASPTTSESIRDFLREFEIDLPPRDSLFTDHFSAHPDSTRNHTLVVLDAANFPDLPHVESILSPETRRGKVVYRGSAHGLGSLPFILPLVRGKDTSYVFDGKEDLDVVEEPYVAGTQAFLVTGFQARNNARVVVASSLDMFSDEFYSMQVDGGKNVNKELGDDLTAWAFHESLVIKSNYLQHRALNSKNESNPQIYRIGDPVTVSLSLSAFDAETASYIPFSNPTTYPVQLEVNMLDPYIRTSLPEISHSDSESIYSKTFDLPDHYGVFNFKIQHRLPGYTYIYEREQFTIRHLQHNEYARFISGAWSYYAGWLSVSFGFLVFCTVWLYHTPKTAVDSAKKSQ